MNSVRAVFLLLLATALVVQPSRAQIPAKDPSTRLGEVLPADVAQRVLARIADARARQLPAQALENRALKFAAKGVDPKDIERSVNEQAQRMESARSALSSGRGSTPAASQPSSMAPPILPAPMRTSVPFKEMVMPRPVYREGHFARRLPPCGLPR